MPSARLRSASRLAYPACVGTNTTLMAQLSGPQASAAVVRCLEPRAGRYRYRRQRKSPLLLSATVCAAESCPVHRAWKSERGRHQRIGGRAHRPCRSAPPSASPQRSDMVVRVPFPLPCRIRAGANSTSSRRQFEPPASRPHSVARQHKGAADRERRGKRDPRRRCFPPSPAGSAGVFQPARRQSSQPSGPQPSSGASPGSAQPHRQFPHAILRADRQLTRSARPSRVGAKVT